MQISRLVPGLAEWLGAAPARFDPQSFVPGEASHSGAISPGDHSSFASDLVAQYDLTRITPRQWTELVDRLHRSGQLDDRSLSDLQAIRRALDQAGVGVEQRVDLIDFVRQQREAAETRLNDAVEAGDMAQIPTARQDVEMMGRQLKWLQSMFAARDA